MVEENPIYDYLKAEGLTDLNESDFVAKYTDRTNLQGVYTYLKENGNTDLEFTAFADKYFPLGGAQEVSAQSSAGTSQTSGQPSGSSAEPSLGKNEIFARATQEELENFTFEDLKKLAQATGSSTDRGGIEPQREGTFRERWDGRWSYDGDGYENYELPQGVFESVFGGDKARAKEYFSQEMPNVLVHLPTGGEYTGQAEMGNVQDIINYDTAQPNEQFLQEMGGQSPASEEPPSFLQSSSNSFSNMLTHIKGLPAKTALLIAQKAEVDPIFSTQWQTLSIGTGITDPKEVRDWAYGRLDDLAEEYRPTRGIIESVGGGDLRGLAAGIVDATTSVLSSAIIAAPTYGAGLLVDMGGESIYSYNTIKADRLGVTVDELYSSGQGADITPILTGGVGYGLEKIGLKGMTKAINRNLTHKFTRDATIFGFDWSKEGLTEWAQVGIETYNESIANGLSQVDAIEEAARVMGSEEGGEALLKGFVGSAVVTGGGRAGKNILRREDRERVDEIEGSALSITQDAFNSDNPTTRETLLDVASRSVDEINSIESSNQDILLNMSEESVAEVSNLLSRLEGIQETLQDPNISDTTKQALGQQADDISSRIDDLIDREGATQAPVTEESATGQAQTKVVSEEAASEGQYFTRDIGGEETVYRRNEDGTASIVPDAGAQQVLAQQSDTSRVSDEVSSTDTTPQQEAEVTPEASISSESPTPQSVEQQKDDIERRRQEEINGLSRFPIKTATEEYNRVESPDGLAAVSKNLLDEINAKYDTELAALDQQSQPTAQSAQQTLSQRGETTVREEVQVGGATEGVQQSEAFMEPEQAEAVNATLQEQGFTPEESTSFLQDIRTEGGRSNRKQASADRIRQYWQSQQNLGIASRQDPEEFARFIRDVAEYAAVSILDGSIRTAKGLAKAIGVTYDENIQQAFEQAQAIVQPIQGATVTPPRTTTKGQIRRSTQGGIQGKVTLTNRQALKTQIQTLNRGIREGRKQIAESRKEITDFIKGMKEAGLFRGKVRGSTVNALINRVNKANTPAQLRNALDYAEKASRIIDYDQKLSTANTLKSRAKRLAKRKGIPADLVPILKGMGSINTRHIDNIEQFNAQMAELISAVDGAGVQGIEQTQHRDLITSVKNKIEQARIQALKDQLIDAGMGSDFVDTLNTMNQLLEAVASIPDESKPSGESKREFRERIYEQTKELLGEIDRTELSPQQSVALDALLGIDVSQVSDQMMATIAVVGKNAAVNQSFAGAGPIIAEYRLQQETSNQKNVDRVKSTVRIASRIGKAARERFGTVIAQIDAVMRDQHAVSAFYALTGFGDILEGSTRYGHRADGVKKIVEGLSKKHAKDLSDSVQSAMYAMYADLNQYKNTWTEEQRVEEFNKRKEAIQTSIDRIEEQMGRDKHFGAQQRDYLSNVKKAWEQVKSAKHPDEIYDKLNSGFKAAYSEMRGFYDSILPEMQDNALIHNNTDLDTDWVNYFPRSYKKLGRPATERKIEQIEEMAGSMGSPLDDIVNQGESSGAKQNRVITGAQLPANATINFDAFNSFYDSSLRALYDIETQPARQYAARALNSGRVAEIFGDATPLEIFRNATIQKISNDQLGLYGGPTSRFRSALRAMSTWGTRLALGGVGQVVKQSIPQMSDTVVRLGNNAHLMAVGINGYLKYNDLLNEAIKDQPVSRRNVATIERQTSVISKRELNEIRKGLSTGVLRGLRIADEVVEAISLSSLKWGDDMAAKASWLAFYLEYKKRNGEAVVDLASELQNPSKDAKAYATQRVELTNNVSDPSLRANTSKHIGSEMLAVIAPFSSFAINAKLELATSLGRLRELGGMNNQERLRTARNIGGNVANILAYNVIGKTIRNIMIGGTASLAYALLNNDDWDEDDEKAARELIDTWKSDAIARNEENSTEYLVNDLIFGGIAERSLQPGIDVVKDLYAKARGEQPKERFARPRTIYDALGIFGIPARTAGRFFNDLSEWTMTDAEWQMRKFSIEDSWGETRYVPLEYRGINRPIFSRKGFGLTTLAHGVALTGASSQEVSALANRLPGLISQIETKLHGRDRKDKLAENESLRKIRVAGQTKELTEEQWEWTVNERRKFLEEVETSDRFVTLQKDELASKVGDELSEKVRRETATEYARAKAIVEFNLVEGVGEKIAEDAKKKASDIISAADLWKKQLNPNTYPKQK